MFQIIFTDHLVVQSLSLYVQTITLTFILYVHCYTHAFACTNLYSAKNRATNLRHWHWVTRWQKWTERDVLSINMCHDG